MRERLTYANVMSTLFVFLLLAGGTALAAKQLGKNTVGAKQLKKNAVTTAKLRKNAVSTAKLRKNAVTTAKLKAGAVNSAKVKDGSLTGADVNAPSMPFGQIVHEAQGSSTVALPSGAGPVIYPLGNATYTQEAGRTDSYVAAVDVTIQPSCAEERDIEAFLLADPADPMEVTPENVVAFGEYEGTGSAPLSTRVNLTPYLAAAGVAPQMATGHTLYLTVSAECKSGDGVAATFGGADVLGTK